LLNDRGWLWLFHNWLRFFNNRCRLCLFYNGSWLRFFNYRSRFWLFSNRGWFRLLNWGRLSFDLLRLLWSFLRSLFNNKLMVHYNIASFFTSEEELEG